MTFKRIRPFKKWKPAHISVSTKGKLMGVILNTVLLQTVPGMNFMIGGKDTCKVRHKLAKHCTIG